MIRFHFSLTMRWCLLGFLVPICLSAVGQPQLRGYRYWFDDEPIPTVSAMVPTPQFHISHADASSLAPGLHTIHFQVQDDALHWSSILSRYVVRVDTLGEPLLAYEYWVDDGYAQAIREPLNSPLVVVPIAAVVSTPGIQPGVLAFHFRVQRRDSTWSSVVSRYFFRNVPALSISGYRFWLDEDFADATEVTLAAPLDQVQLTTLNLGPPDSLSHRLYIQFRDSLGQWGVIYSEIIRHDGSGNPSTAVETASFSFELFPNPNRGRFEVRSSVVPIDLLTVHDLTGRMVAASVQLRRNEAQVQTGFRGLALVRIHTARGTFVEKVLLE